MRRLLLAPMLLWLACTSPPVPQPPPMLEPQSEAEVRPLLIGVWRLQSIDGQPAIGWLGFTDNERGHHVEFSLNCGSQYGHYSVEGNTVTLDAPMSVGPDCKLDDLESSPIRVPKLLDLPFEVNVSRSSLVARATDRFGRTTWARYTRTSYEAMVAEGRQLAKQRRKKPGGGESR